MKVAICQPTYLPWSGYFDLMDQVDVFILLDDVQFEKRSWQQRNRIKTPVGLQWLTVPVITRGRREQLINEVEIETAHFSFDHCRAIELNYRRAQFFENYFDELISRLRPQDGMQLADLNLRLIEWFMKKLGIETRLVVSSSLRQSGKRTELLANLCESQGANLYVSPLGSSVYLLKEKDALLAKGIDVVFQHYEHPEYRQQFPPFLPYASVLDLILNEGDRSLEILRTGRRPAFLLDDVAHKAAEKMGAQ
jgi:predicted HAD superfamily phosphohydrolase